MMKRLKIVLVIIFLTLLGIPSLSFAETSIIDLGNVHYSEAPKSWVVDIPNNAVKVEVGIYGKGQTQINKYAGWNGYLKLNGKYLWKMTGLDSNKAALIQDYILNKQVVESTGRNSWQDITGIIKYGSNKITYYHYTGGDGAGVKIKITTSTEAKSEIEQGKAPSTEKSSGYDIKIISTDLRYFETIFVGRLTQNGLAVQNVQIGVEDPLKRMSVIGPKTNKEGYFVYSTNPYINYRSAKSFLFAYGDAQRPYVIAERFSKYEMIHQDISKNEAYNALDENRKEKVQKYQEIVNGTSRANILTEKDKIIARDDIRNIMVDSALAEKVVAGMEIVDWAGSVGMCAKGLAAAGPTGGVSSAACAPLGVKLVNKGVDVSTDILVKKGYITGRAAQIIDSTSSTATSCISFTDPIDTASCMAAVASEGLHVVSYELENNDYGQPAVIVNLAKKASKIVDYTIVIIGS
jgi:hypothetical protein